MMKKLYLVAAYEAPIWQSSAKWVSLCKVDENYFCVFIFFYWKYIYYVQRAILDK